MLLPLFFNIEFLFSFLKPENILLTDDMHIQLTDFGSSFIVEDNEVPQTDDHNVTNGEKKPLKRMNSFVGTAQFVAPEILQRGPVHYGFVR
jgi:3-phosphoinositide dependent protein kinase-1